MGRRWQRLRPRRGVADQGRGTDITILLAAFDIVARMVGCSFVGAEGERSGNSHERVQLLAVRRHREVALGKTCRDQAWGKDLRLHPRG